MSCKKCKCKVCSCIKNEIPKIAVNGIIQNPNEEDVVNIKVPTKTSQLINDSGFGQGNGGGSGGQKIENIRVNGELVPIINKEALVSVPTKTSDLTNDSNFVSKPYVDSHIVNKANPHEVTKFQVGLGNVDNTSDLNKPISTATQNELDKKISTTDIKSEIVYEDLKPVNSVAIEKHSVKKINTVVDLRNTIGEYEGQIISLLGYYEAGDKESLNYKWTNTQGVDDGGSIINSGIGSWKAIFKKEYVDVRDFGAKGDGVSDDSEFFKKAVNTKKVIKVFSTPYFYYIGERITLNNSLIGVGLPKIKTSIEANNFYQKDSEPVILDRYTAFSIVNKDTDDIWYIDGLEIDGQYDGIHGHQTSPIGTKLTEFEHNIHLSASRNVVIQNCVLKNPVGDNIYLGRNTANQGEPVLDQCENIIIRNNTMTNPYRCNIAFVSVKQCEVYENICDKTWEYVKPFDLEPNGGDRRLICRNINIYSNSITFTGDYAILIFGATDSTYSNESFPNLTYSTKDINISNNILKARDAGVRCHYSQASVSNIIVDNNVIDSALFVSGSGTGTYYVRNLIVKNNKNVSIDKTETRIASINRAINVEVSNNQIKDITSTGSSGIQIVNIQSAKITNNKITGTNTIPAIRIAGTSSDISIENNTLESNISCIRVNSGTVLENLKIKDNYLMSVTENPIFSDNVNIDKCNISGNVWDYKNKDIINSVTYFSGGIAEQNQGKAVIYVNQLPDITTLTSKDNGTIYKLYRKSSNSYLNNSVGSISYMYLNGVYIGLDFIGEFQGIGTPSINNSVLKNGQRYINTEGGLGNTNYVRENNGWKPIATLNPVSSTSFPASANTVGFTIYDTTNKVPMWWTGTEWKQAVTKSVNVTNSTADDATDLATALTLVNELKVKLNAKLTADRNSGQQAT